LTNIKEALLHKIFNYLKENNLFIHEEWKIQAQLFHVIEDYLISSHLSEYLFLETCDIRTADFREKKRLKDECVFLNQAGELLHELNNDIEKFLKIQKNKDQYLEEEFQEINYMYNSINIFHAKIKGNDFEDLVYNFSHHLESDYKKMHGYMKKAGVNYLDKTEDGKMFYPLITDIFIDYWRIRSNYIAHQDLIKKHTNDYNLFKKRIEEERLDFPLELFFIIKHFKLNWKNHIHNFLLAQYHDKISDNYNLNKIFRKLFLIKRDDDFCTPKTIETYKQKYKQTDKIFLFASCMKFFI